MNNFNKFALDLSNAKGIAELKVNGKPYKVQIDNLSHVRSTDGDEVHFTGEVLNTDLNYHEFIWQVDEAFAKYCRADVENVRNVYHSSGHSTPYTPKVEITRNPDLRYNIDKVIFNNPATIIIWKDGSKTVVKCQEGETFDEEKGLAIAIAKKALGNKGNFNEVFKEHVKNEPEKKEEHAEDNRGKEGKWIVEETGDYRIPAFIKKVSCSACGGHTHSCYSNNYN